VPGTNPAPKFFTALLDTGASNTCVSPKVVADIGLLTTGIQQMASATHVTLVNTYLMDVGIVFGGNILWKFTNIPVLEFQPTAGSPYEMLIGRDVICQGALTISFDGHYTFSI
jgi:predicted aspartyl protease